MADAVQKYHSEGLTGAPAGEWARILGQLKAEIGDDAFRNWLRPINLERVESGQATAAQQGAAAPLNFIVGNEHIEVSATIEMLRFTF